VRKLLARELPTESILQILDKQDHKINQKTLARDIEKIQECFPRKNGEPCAFQASKEAWIFCSGQ